MTYETKRRSAPPYHFFKRAKSDKTLCSVVSRDGSALIHASDHINEMLFQRIEMMMSEKFAALEKKVTQGSIQTEATVQYDTGLMKMLCLRLGVPSMGFQPDEKTTKVTGRGRLSGDQFLGQADAVDHQYTAGHSAGSPTHSSIPLRASSHEVNSYEGGLLGPGLNAVTAAFESTTPSHHLSTQPLKIVSFKDSSSIGQADSLVLPSQTRLYGNDSCSNTDKTCIHDEHYRQLDRPYVEVPISSFSTSKRQSGGHNLISSAYIHTKPPPMIFQMDREIVSVIDLYREWFIPGADGLCVETLERGSKAWRKGPQNKTFFLRRKVVIEEIVKVARETGKPQVEIAQMFERVRSERNIGLAKLASAIKKGEIKVV